MKKALVNLFILSIPLFLSAQFLPPNNLAKNPHFLEFSYHIVPNVWDGCGFPQMPCGYYNENTSLWHVFCLLNWITPNRGTSAYCQNDSCNSSSFYPSAYFYPLAPYNKKGLVAMDLYADFGYKQYRQYVQGSLIDTLLSGHKYCVAMYAMFDNYTFRNSYWWGANVLFTSSLGILFSDSPISRNDTEPFYEYYPPQIENSLNRFLTDSVNWMLISGSFVAEGDEKYITIGNILPDTLTPLIQFKQNTTNSVSYSAYIIGFIGVYDCNGFNYQCEAGDDLSICKGEIVELGTDQDSRRQYFWSPGISLSDSTTARPLSSPTQTTTYFLRVVDEFLQQSYDTITVEVLYCDIFIPNIFSPNGDGQNDVLYVRGQGIEQLTFVVYNRWGEKVFESTDPNRGWDGTINGQHAETGVYVYQVRAVLADGLVVNKHGNVSLVR